MDLGRRLANLGRAPLAEWHELARATQTPGPVARWFARHFLLVVGLPGIGLVACLLGGAPRLALAFWVLGAVLDWAATRADSPVARIAETAGATPALRAALRSLLVVWALGTTPAAAASYVAIVVVVQAAWLGLTALASGFSRAAPPLRYVPGAASQPQPLAGYSRFYRRAAGTPAAFVGAEALALTGAAVVAFGEPGPAAALLAAGAVVALGYGGIAAAGFLRLLRRTDADATALLAELAAADPRYLVHVSLGAGQSRYIVNQWLPVLDATPTAGVIAVREASQLAPLRATRVPVVYAPSPRDLEQLILPRIAAALYLAYGDKNAQLLRDPALKHVMLLHGDSDKATSANAQARGFDEVWVAGQAAIDRYLAAGVEAVVDRFVVIGRPQVEPLLAAEARDPGAPAVVLYAPTFEGYYEQTAHSSLDTMGPAMVRRLLERFPDLQIWFKPHPASGVVRPSMLAAIAEIEGLLGADPHVIVDRRPDLTLTDCLARADLLISDISSVVSDYLATRRPVVVTNPSGLAPADFRAAYPSQRGSYVVGPDLAGLDEAIAQALGSDPLRPEREALVGYLLGDLPAGPQAAFDAALARLAATSSR